MEAKPEPDTVADSTSVLSHIPINLPHRPKKLADEDRDQLEAENKEDIGENNNGNVEAASENQVIEGEKTIAESLDKTISAPVKKKSKKRSKGKKGKVGCHLAV